MDTGQTALLTQLERGPGGLAWSPDGSMIAFSMFVPDTPPPFAQMPAKPEGATWAPPATTYERLYYRSDSQGFLPVGYSHVFVLPAEGGTPRQVTHGPYNHGGTPEWTPDSQHLLISATRRARLGVRAGLRGLRVLRGGWGGPAAHGPARTGLRPRRVAGRRLDRLHRLR